jgi:hypothetical protein
MKDLLSWFYWALPLVYLCLAITKVNFGWDGNDLVWRAGVCVATCIAILVSKKILDFSPLGAKKNYAKACTALIALPLTVHVLGISIINNIPGLGSH